MKLTRSVCHLGLLAACLLLLTACAGDEDGATPSPAGTGTAVVERPTASPVPTARPEELLTTVEIARSLRPSVVRILTEGATLDIFGRAVPSRGVGTGLILDEEGHIVTNHHVLLVGNSLGSRITVTLDDQRTFTARVVGTDPPTDLAVLHIAADGLTPATLGRAADLPVGAEVVAIGQALGLEGDPTVTRGVVSAKGRVIREDPYTINDAIQTDASINPGNSGGPLVNSYAEVVGINTAIIQGAQNIGFAISIDLAKPIVEELIKEGQVSRGFLGVDIVDITPSLASNFDLPVDYGVGITGLQQGGPADLAGLRPEDIIVRLADQEIDNNGDLLQALTVHRAGETVEVQYYRGQELRETEVSLAERP
ncbi:MAG: trypsin-like peptidase domain-containing protein [Dehalococcoidia bacterium]